MDQNKICHTENNAFLEALNSCLSSGLSVWLEGIPQTGESLSHRMLLKEEADWVGTFLEDEQGVLKGISFTDSHHGNTLLQ